MKTQIPASVIIAAGVLLVYTAGAAETAPPSPVLIELFTSEGCSSCPPADALLAKLDAANDAENPQVIVLSEHVDYFNGPGWKDPNSSSAYTERQNNYAGKLHLNSVYTPEMVVNGSAEFVGSDAREARSKIAAAAARPVSVPVKLYAVSPGIVRVEIAMVPAAAKIGAADVMVAVASNETSTQVLGGENGGRKLRHVAVVRTLSSVGQIHDGQSFSKEIDLGRNPGNLRLVAWVQQHGQGRVLGVAMRLMEMTPAPRAAN